MTLYYKYCDAVAEGNIQCSVSQVLNYYFFCFALLHGDEILFWFLKQHSQEMVERSGHFFKSAFLSSFLVSPVHDLSWGGKGSDRRQLKQTLA